MDYKEKVIALLNSQELSKEQKEKLENIFPELKESKDDRIVRCLLNYFNHVRYNGLDLKGTDIDEVIAWLEKQDEKKETPCDKCKKEQPSHSCQDITELGRCALEKQGENNPTDKVEPKFRVGDWISGYFTSYKVMAINSKGYMVEDTDGNKINILFENEKFHHLFTIKDAKDGDVLVHNGYPFIFMGIKDGIVQALEENLLEGTNPVNFGEPKIDKDYQPATKEQRELLFQKMKEAGYEWDGNKKELKKIEPKALDVWNAEDEQNLNVVLSFIPDECLRRWLKDKLCYDTLDANKVIEWLTANVRLYASLNFLYGSGCPQGDIEVESLIKSFKKDFGL